MGDGDENHLGAGLMKDRVEHALSRKSYDWWLAALAEYWKVPAALPFIYADLGFEDTVYVEAFAKGEEMVLCGG